MEKGARAADIQELRRVFWLDRLLLAQYTSYRKRLLQGDLGQSFRFNSPVTDTILARYPATMELALAVLLVALLLAIPAGVHSAVHRGQWRDRLLGFLRLLGHYFPSFALGPVLILVFAILLGGLPVSGYGTFPHLILPAFTLSAALAAILTRIVRASLLEELRQEGIGIPTRIATESTPTAGMWQRRNGGIQGLRGLRAVCVTVPVVPRGGMEEAAGRRIGRKESSACGRTDTHALRVQCAVRRIVRGIAAHRAHTRGRSATRTGEIHEPWRWSRRAGFSGTGSAWAAFHARRWSQSVSDPGGTSSPISRTCDRVFTFGTLHGAGRVFIWQRIGIATLGWR